MWKDAQWLKLPQAEVQAKNIYHGDMTGRFAYFRCEVELPGACTLSAVITANSRYRLWVNETPVLSGPCKGDMFRQYFEKITLSPYLKAGKNVFCVQVLYCDPDTADRQTDARASIYGVIGQRCGHRLAVEGDILDAHGEAVDTVTTGKADWRVWLDGSFYLRSDDITCYLGAVIEEIDFAKSPAHWKTPGFDASAWLRAEAAVSAVPQGPLCLAGVQPRFRLREREIPLLYEREEHFVRDFTVPDGNPAGLLEKGSLTVPAGKAMEIILDAGSIQNGYPRYAFSGGAGAVVTMTYFEKFGGPGSDLRRTDYVHGKIVGLTDTVRLAGGVLCYEPFWVRCFRFVRVTVHTEEEPVTLSTPVFRRTGYPLKVGSSIRSSEPWVEKLWDICVRTLGNCMMETYMDCPYHEQLQFAMDTRLEALFTYAVSGDPALVRKALADFHCGMQPEGLTAGKYPSAYLQILSTFSLHYIYMLWEYYQQTGDAQTVRQYRGDVDRILDYYDARTGADGLVGALDFWQFVDWQDAWMATAGTPSALQEGPSTIINLMYAYALFCGSRLFAETGRKSLSEEYAVRRNTVLRAVQKQCWDAEKGLYREGPDYPQYSQHAQAWAVLNGLVYGRQARDVLTRAMQEPTCLKCSFSTAYEWFRALENAGMYREMRGFLNDWIDLLKLDCTACPETPAGARSDCHAWSALPMYEMMRTMAGVKNAGCAWNKIQIEPHLMDLPSLEGRAVTPGGAVTFCYQRKTGGTLRCHIELPENVRAEFICPDGSARPLQSGVNEITVAPAADS